MTVWVCHILQMIAVIWFLSWLAICQTLRIDFKCRNLTDQVFETKTSPPAPPPVIFPPLILPARPIFLHSMPAFTQRQGYKNIPDQIKNFFSSIFLLFFCWPSECSSIDTNVYLCSKPLLHLSLLSHNNYTHTIVYKLLGLIINKKTWTNLSFNYLLCMYRLDRSMWTRSWSCKGWQLIIVHEWAVLDSMVIGTYLLI